jgi:hypothetical protein
MDKCPVTGLPRRFCTCAQCGAGKTMSGPFLPTVTVADGVLTVTQDVPGATVPALSVAPRNGTCQKCAENRAFYVNMDRSAGRKIGAYPCNRGIPPHTCPYKTEMHNDCEECNCCEKCQTDCQEDI